MEVSDQLRENVCGLKQLLRGGPYIPFLNCFKIRKQLILCQQFVYTGKLIGNGGIIDGNEVEIKVKVGDKVLFNKYANSEFKIDKTTYLLIKQADILAIMED